MHICTHLIFICIFKYFFYDYKKDGWLNNVMKGVGYALYVMCPLYQSCVILRSVLVGHRLHTPVWNKCPSNPPFILTPQTFLVITYFMSSYVVRIQHQHHLLQLLGSACDLFHELLGPFGLASDRVALLNGMVFSLVFGSWSGIAYILTDMKITFGFVVVSGGITGVLSFISLALAIGTEYWYIIEDKRTNHTDPARTNSGLWGVTDGMTLILKCLLVRICELPLIIVQLFYWLVIYWALTGVCTVVQWISRTFIGIVC